MKTDHFKYVLVFATFMSYIDNLNMLSNIKHKHKHKHKYKYKL